MKINFFEEFPSVETLSKARGIDFPCTIYLAAKSLKEFEKFADYIKIICPEAIPAYWPVLDKYEGYWLSPFSETAALERVFEELKDYRKNLTVLLDLELPVHAPRLFFKNFLKFFRNKRIIKNFLKDKPKNMKIATAEYPLGNAFFNLVLSFFGVHAKKADERIFMCYTSMARNRYLERVLLKEIEKQASVGLGVLATGILGHEQIISAENLERDLALAQKAENKTVTIFRLGGLNEAYLKIINNFKPN